MSVANHSFVFSPACRLFARPRRGSVIVVVLVTLLLASLMLTKFIENSAVELTLATRQADRTRLRADAYAALETALAVMAEIKAVDESLHSPAQGWGDPYGYAGETPREGVTAEFVFTDESGKVSLPKISFDDMVILAQALGLAENDARRFSDGLYTWMSSQHTTQDVEAEASRYERDIIPHQTPKRPLRSWEEMRAIRVARDYVYDENGALTPFGVALQANVSLYEFEGANVNALAPAISVARGWDATQAGLVASYQTGKVARPAGAPNWFRGAQDLTAILGANADVKGIDAVAKLVRVEVTVREGAASMRLVTLVGLDESVKLPSVAQAPGTASGASTPGGASAPATENAQGRNSAANGNSRAGASPRETSGGGATSEKTLNYPFAILEVIETAGPAPAAPTVEAEEAPLT